MAIQGTRIVPNKLVLDFQYSNLFAIREVVANHAARVGSDVDTLQLLQRNSASHCELFCWGVSSLCDGVGVWEGSVVVCRCKQTFPGPPETATVRRARSPKQERVFEKEEFFKCSLKDVPSFCFCLFVFLLSYLSLGTRRQALSALQMKKTKKFSAHQSVMATDHWPIGQRINLTQTFIPEAFLMTNHFCSSRKLFSIYFWIYLELIAFREYLY